MLDLLREPQILCSLELTARTCLISLVLFLLAGPAVGFLLARRPSTPVRVFGFLVTMPLVFPPVALGYMLQTVLGRTGPLGALFADAGFSLIFSEAAVAAAGFVAGLPLVVRPLQAPSRPSCFSTSKRPPEFTAPRRPAFLSRSRFRSSGPRSPSAC